MDDVVDLGGEHSHERRPFGAPVPGVAVDDHTGPAPFVDHVDDVTVGHHATGRRHVGLDAVVVPDLVELGQRPGEVGPVAHLIESLLPVERGGERGAAVERVGHHGHQFNVAGLCTQVLVGQPEALGDERTVRCADGVEEGEHHRPSGQRGQRDGMPARIGQGEGRCRDVDQVGRSVGRLDQEGVGVGVGGGHRHGGGADQHDGHRQQGEEGAQEVGGVEPVEPPGPPGPADVGVSRLRPGDPGARVSPRWPPTGTGTRAMAT